jgi:hypothetical protein
MKPTKREVSDLTEAELRAIVEAIRQSLWFDGREEQWDIEKEWDCDTLEFIAGALEAHSRQPAEKEVE